MRERAASIKLFLKTVTFLPKLCITILKLTLSRENSEELLQEVFIKVYNNLYQYNNRYNFSTWLYKIAVNTFKNDYRKRKRERMSISDEFPEEVVCNLDECPETVYEMKEYYKEIARLINRLKNEQKLCFVLKHVQGFSYKEIAEVLGISPEAARMKTHRAKYNLGKKFKEFYGGGVLNVQHE